MFLPNSHRPTPELPRDLATAAEVLRLLAVTELTAEPNDPQTEDYYTAAERLIAPLVTTPAASWEGLRIKAEAVAWCCGSRTDFALGDTLAERLIASLLSDLLAGRDRP